MKESNYNFIILILFISISTGIYANKSTSNQILNNNSTLSELKSKSESEKKPILLYFTAKWCSYCKLMEDSIFINPDFSNYYNQNFLIKKIDADTEEGREMRSQFYIGAYPTLLFIDHNFDVIYRKTGYTESNQLISIGKEVISLNSSYLETLNSIGNQNNSISPDSLKNILYGFDQLKTDSILLAYFTSVDTSFWSLPAYWELLKQVSSFHSPLTQLIKKIENTLIKF